MKLCSELQKVKTVLDQFHKKLSWDAAYETNVDTFNTKGDTLIVRLLNNSTYMYVTWDHNNKNYQVSVPVVYPEDYWDTPTEDIRIIGSEKTVYATVRLVINTLAKEIRELIFEYLAFNELEGKYSSILYL